MIPIFDIRQRIKLTIDNYNNRNKTMNMPMLNPTFKIYKMSPISIEFQVYNNDRKLIDLTNHNFEIILYNKHKKEILLKRQLEVINKKLFLNLESSDTINWDEGFYEYSITISDTNSSYLLSHSEEYDSNGRFEVLPSVTNFNIDSIVIEKFMPTNDIGLITRFVSTPIKAGSHYGYNHLKTMAIYGKDFSGELVILGSIDDNPPLNMNDWFIISVGDQKSILYKNFTGIDSITFKANVKWIKFYYIPELNHIEKILIRT